MYLVRPSEDRKGEKCRREPRIEDILVPFQSNLVLWYVESLCSISQCFGLRSPRHPEVIISFITNFSISYVESHEISGNAMSPPQLSNIGDNKFESILVSLFYFYFDIHSFYAVYDSIEC